MSRFHRFVHLLASSYVSLAAGMVYVLVSVPLALHYLPKKEFGLWAVMAQVVGYIALIELGMTSSVARHLIDHKDELNAGSYGGVIQTGSLVLAIQGMVAILVGCLLSPMIARLLAIPADLQQDFVLLLRWQCVIAAFDLATRVFPQILHAHQRGDLNCYADTFGYGLNLLVLWFAFHQGQGLYSILWSGGIVTVYGALSRLIMCWKWQMLPQIGCWGRPTWKVFKELFHYGTDLFLLALGAQFTNASQVIVISRILGLDAAAVWSICTRLFGLVGELIWRIFNLAEPMLSEMIVRGEHDRMHRRFRDVVSVTGSTSVLAAVALAVLNDPFVRVWTAGKIFWTPWNDVLLGIWLVIRSIVRCHMGLTIIAKKIGSLRFVVFAEGIVFVALALLVSRFGGIPAVIGASIICALLVTGNYVVRRTASFFDDPLREVIFGWANNLVRLSAFLIPAALLIWWISRILPMRSRLFWDVGILGIIGGLLWVRLGIPRDLQLEILRRVPGPYRLVLSRLLSVRP